jgi:dTDP-4-amino-4,6-dideoxygalactose transaminase
VDPQTWKTTPDIARRALSQIDGDPLAIIPVSPFGRPINSDEWRNFREETGIEVVIDSAAGFDSLTADDIPRVVSLHATKVLAAGEGGFVVSTEPNIISDVKKYINFGFSGDRFSRTQGTNAKMSEYQAAVALASLDCWHKTRSIFSNITKHYQDRITSKATLSILPSPEDNHVTSSIMLESKTPLPQGFDERLLENGIETRRWWGKGLHAQILNRKIQSTSLTQTKQLAESCIGLPCFPGITTSEIDYVVDNILRELR